MSNDYYNKTGAPVTRSAGSSSTIRSEFSSIESGFEKLPVLTGNNGKIAAVNAGATALEAKTPAELGLITASNFPNVNASVLASDEELNFSVGVTSSIQPQLNAKANLASPVFTGDPKAPTPSPGDNDTSIATTEFVNTAIANKASAGANTDITSLNAPELGAATATTQPTTDDSTKLATTAFVQDIADLLCPPGTILPFAGNTVPAGFLEVPTTQTIVSIATYPRLFAAIGTLWGGNGSTTFGIPFLKADYTWLQAGVGAVGTETVGEVISHSHSTGRALAPGPSGWYWPGPGPNNATDVSGETGGPFNKAAGARVKFMVKY